MRPLRFAATALLLAAAQGIGGRAYAIGPIRPDLLLPLAVFVALRAAPPMAIAAAMAIGAARDLATVDPFGTGIVSYGIAAVAVSIGRRILEPERPGQGAILMGCGSALGALSFVLAPPLRLLEWIPHPGWIIVGDVAYTALAALAILSLLDRWREWLGLCEGEGVR